MHMADALISPAVGGAMWAATAGLTVYCARKLKDEADERRVPLMGVLGAFIFAAQMINFSIPATGSSGHLGGGMILAILLGPHAAFLTMASVLTVQALFFGDGGLLGLGCNIFNLGFWPCFVAYPFIYRKIVGATPTSRRIFIGATLSGIIGLQLGAFSVVLETLFSGISALPFTTFVLLMQPIHLAIGLVEGLVTTAVVTFVWRADPGILAPSTTTSHRSLKPVLIGLLVAALLTGGAFSWFASTHPDGLEWAMFHTSGAAELAPPSDRLHKAMDKLQEWTAVMPDYGFKSTVPAEATAPAPEGASWPGVSAGTSTAGVLGGILTLALAFGIGALLRRLRRSA